ncbi:pyridoxal phosphate-dependent aminotransferase [Kribbella sp. NPDC051718]|uniref:pyridoxal phosphate-dependent aminotransferase n=1 Tax=Kribbella sp. NPDC051718 TaxID=3155168 RepID=UPI0034316CDD
MRGEAVRLQGLGTTIFAEMSALAVRTGSVNLGQGFPDTDGPDSLLEDAVAAIRGGANQYPPGRGIPALRQAIVEHQERFYGLTYDPDTQVLVTTGATEAIAAALLAYVEPGDEVIALEPYYDSYAACIAMAGGRRVPVTLRAPDFRLDLDELRAAVTPRTKVLLINSPHNPTGTVLDDTELRGIASIAVEHDLVVITDEVYEHLIFDGLQHRPLTAYDGMADRTISIGSAGKTFSVTGWKIGWVTGAPAVVTAVNTAKQFLTYVSGAPFQPAVAGALALGNDYFDTLRSTMQAKRDLLCDGLQSLGFGVHRPQGTYFVTTDIRPLGHTDGIEFCRMLPERVGVVAIPTQVFYDNTEAGRPLVRWAFCKKPEVLEEALSRLTKL